MMLTPEKLTSKLIQYQSITPKSEGIFDYIESFLLALGFNCQHYHFEDVHNFHAQLGQGKPHFCFSGHIDVVPAHPESSWKYPPFAGKIEEGFVWGRGASDMKGAIAAFLIAVHRFCTHDKPDSFGTLSLLLTSDEEGIALNGTKRVLPVLKQKGIEFDHCLVGEPSNPHQMGEAIKIGRRGSLNMKLELKGKAGHVAYPEKAQNPAPILIEILTALQSMELDQGTDYFQPSNLEITTIDIGNPSHNVIFSKARTQLNIRYNILHRGKDLKQKIEHLIQTYTTRYQIEYDLEIELPGSPFLTPASDYSALVQHAVQEITGKLPELSTSGGTSDARFIKDYCPVLEYGLVSETIHQMNERAAISDIENLTNVYELILKTYFHAK